MKTRCHWRRYRLRKGWSGAVAQAGRNDQLATPTRLHAHHSLVPAQYDDALAQREGERLAGPRSLDQLPRGVRHQHGHRDHCQRAEATGTGLGPAIDALEAARQLGSLPATEEAMRNGRLSETHVKEIAGAAIPQPEAEQELVSTAENQPLTMLKLRCRRGPADRGGEGRVGSIRR